MATCIHIQTVLTVETNNTHLLILLKRLILIDLVEMYTTNFNIVSNIIPSSKEKTVSNIACKSNVLAFSFMYIT